MSIKEMDMRAATYFELLEQIEALQVEAEAIRDSFKTVMVDQAAEELEGTGWRATWHNVTSSRLDSRKLKADMPDLYKAYSKSSTTCRFTLNAITA